ncbi:MAG: hypothetical protein CK425_05060 [Parachlamydia sp.]|nr:MAG: hypothetical protein CK425_05060 [Parachlamydia sp.]
MQTNKVVHVNLVIGIFNGIQFFGKPQKIQVATLFVDVHNSGFLFVYTKSKPAFDALLYPTYNP